MAEQPSGSDRLGVPRSRFVARECVQRVLIGLFAIVATIATIVVPHAPTGEMIDESWQLVLSNAYLHGVHFGRDLAFTYGPFGWLENHVQVPELYWPQLLWQLTTRAGVMILIAAAIGFRRQFVGVALALAVLCTTRSNIPMTDAFQLYALWVCGCVLLRRSLDVFTVLAIALVAALGLVKFTALLAAVAIVGLAAIVWLGRRRVGPAAAIVVGTGGVWLFGWIAARQSIADIPAYLAASWSVAAPYTDAMAVSVYEPLGLPLAAGCVAALLWVVLKPFRRDLWPPIVLTLGLLLLVWRHSVSRPDIDHLSNAYVWIALVSLSWPARAWLRTSVALASVIAWNLSFWSAQLPAIKASDAVASARSAAHAVTSPAQSLDAWRSEFRTAADHFALPQIASIIGTQPVDMHGNEQKIALLNGFAFRPRPVPQSYSAYSAELADRNRDWLERVAPKYSLVRIEAIDGRMPTAEDAPCLAWLLTHDTWRAEERGFALMERTADRPVPPSEYQARATLHVGEWIELPAEPPKCLMYARLYPVQTLAARALQGLVPARGLFVQLHRSDDQVEQYWLPAPIAPSGFLLAPFLRSNDDLRDWYRAPASLVRITAIRVVSPGALWFEPAMAMTITVQRLK